MNELNPCPFCGGVAHVYKNNLWHVACERAHNGCVTMSAFATEAEAIAAWNNRVEFRQGNGECTPHGEWESISQTQEVRHVFCECGCELGMDERDSWPFQSTRLFAMPNYCQECGRKIRKEGEAMSLAETIVFAVSVVIGWELIRKAVKR